MLFDLFTWGLVFELIAMVGLVVLGWCVYYCSDLVAVFGCCSLLLLNDVVI